MTARIRVLSCVLLAVPGMMAAMLQPAVADSSASDDDLDAGGVQVTVTDYTTDGVFVSTETEIVEIEGESYQTTADAPGIEIEVHLSEMAATDGGFTTYSYWNAGSGSTSVAAPSASSGCRTIHIRTWYGSAILGKFYELKNQTYFCYNKSTRRVSSANPSWTLMYNDGLNDISTFQSNAGYYNYNSWGSKSGYENERTWKVLRDPGVGVLSYYPRADVYARGNGSGYAIWRSK